jgi:hypothetical protein
MSLPGFGRFREDSMNKLIIAGAVALLSTSVAQAASPTPVHIPRMNGVAMPALQGMPGSRLIAQVQETVGGLKTPKLFPLPGLCDGSAAACLPDVPRLPEVPATELPYWVGANVSQYRYYVLREAVPSVQSWAGMPHLKNINHGAQDAVAQVVNVNACDGVCAPTVNARGAPQAISRLEQVGKGIIPNPPSPPTPIMPGGR